MSIPCSAHWLTTAARLRHTPYCQGSPAINAGDAALAGAADQRGASRSGSADIGAYEVGLPPNSFIVTSLGDTNDPGTLRRAINDANASSAVRKSIQFAAGVQGVIQLTAALPALNTNLTIAGPGANLMTIKGPPVNTPSRIFSVTMTGIVSLSGLTLSDGFDNDAAGGGGGINNKGRLTISQCAISNNTSRRGGAGIYNEGELTITSSTINANNTFLATNIRGGGIYNNGSVTLLNSTISQNKSIQGGGIYNDTHGNMTLRHCTIFANSAIQGSGIRNTITLSSDSTIVAGNVNLDNVIATTDYVGLITSLGHNLIGFHNRL